MELGKILPFLTLGDAHYAWYKALSKGRGNKMQQFILLFTYFHQQRKKAARIASKNVYIVKVSLLCEYFATPCMTLQCNHLR